jgi:hypothetical protein
MQLGQHLLQAHYEVRLVHEPASLATLLNYFAPELLIADQELYRQQAAAANQPSALILLMGDHTQPANDAMPPTLLTYRIRAGAHLPQRLMPIVQELIGTPELADTRID